MSLCQLVRWHDYPRLNASLTAPAQPDLYPAFFALFYRMGFCGWHIEILTKTDLADFLRYFKNNLSSNMF